MKKQRVLIIGANGKIGKLVCEKLILSNEFEPIAAIRNANQAAHFNERGIVYRLIDLEGSVQELQQAFETIDIIVFSAGSGGHTGHDKTLTIDLDGAVKSMEAAKTSGIKRYIMVSAIHADDREAWDETGIKPYFIAKHYADELLKSSELTYTILRPARLLDGKGTGKISTSVSPESDLQIFREDVAEVIIETIPNELTIYKVIDIINGHQDISKALASLS
ncbi:SDR family oxidoreductase [Olivibacter sp. SDN3]|uniref:SDR family oxidoreductase n=1 Tax=Olivibacter sp. SDN3 TaxID=2764720 RepID=UPI0016516878|nr:SDR family oxidoreductase [Olivibacter sp. SDN3]QNL49216.1 SDR family oxidoreductase [Olivibacter sp. SDN3]